MHYIIPVAWFTWPERPKGEKDGSQAGPKGRQLKVWARRAPRLHHIKYMCLSGEWWVLIMLLHVVTSDPPKRRLVEHSRVQGG